MVMQKSKSSLMSKLGNKLREAHEEHKNDETVASAGGDLPPGISGGIAKVVDCKFDFVKDDKKLAGEPYFYAAAIVVRPKEFNGMIIQGERTSIMEMLCDTPERESRKTVSDHLGWVYNQLRLLGADTSNLDVDDLEATAAAIKEAGPYIKFRTWAGKPTKEYPNPRTNHVWGGTVDYNEDDDPSNAVVDETPPAPTAPARAAAKPSTNGTPAKGPAVAKQLQAQGKTAPQQAGPKPGTRAPAKPAPAPEPEPEPFNEFETADDLLALITSGDEDAEQRLSDMATAAGISDEDIANAPDWATLAAMVNDAQQGSAGELEADAGDEVTVGYVYSFLPPKGKKKVEVEVVSLNAAKKTATVKDLANPKIQYKDVAYDKLEMVQ